jgi:hypothetical protein
MPKLRQLIAGLLPWGPRFAHRAANVGFVADNVALGWAFSEFFRFPLSISVHSCSIFTDVSSWGWIVCLVAVAVPQRLSPFATITIHSRLQ